MMAEYDKVLAELGMMEEANKPLDAAKRAEIEGGKVASFGPADAAVTIVGDSQTSSVLTATWRPMSRIRSKKSMPARVYALSFVTSLWAFTRTHTWHRKRHSRRWSKESLGNFAIYF